MIPLIVLGVAVVMIAVEIMTPGRRWPKVAGWWTRALLLNGVQVGVAYLTALILDPWFAERRPWSADELGPTGGAIVGYLAITFIYYWWHRARHASSFLWRWFHQVHHSPQRIEIITSFYKHPVEIVGNGILSSAIAYLLVGLSPQVSTYAVLLTGLAELFYHWNVPTPWWIGFIIQRPESHCIHHQSGVHGYNYGDLPIYDILFGTFRNPRHWDARCGFGARELELGRMLAGRDVEPPAEPLP
jgi:sterol desaturase/sphingolipid hydroxylase (fatty acid hydroxylase superfamily)